MATRRSTEKYGEEQEEDSGIVDSGTGPRVDEFGNVVPDFAGDPNFPTPFVDYKPDEMAGNTERGASFQAGGQTPTEGVRGPVNAPPPPPQDALPQGVSVNETMDTPPQSSEPNPIAWQPANPMSSMAPSMTGITEGGPLANGPKRRSTVNPQIFAETGNPSLSGRAGGLLAGGMGASGNEASGPIQPTQMMKKLLQMFSVQ